MLHTTLLVLALATTPRGDLVVLTQTGRAGDGRAIVAPLRGAAPYVEALTRGYPGTVLRLYSLAQRLDAPGRAIRPAYLVLTDNRGGFPRRGFLRDGVVEPETRYVDLHRTSALVGRPGSIDQIFPHELLHHCLHELAGPPPEVGSNQVHAVGVRTDRAVALDEGFAEHAQIMVIDDPVSASATRALGRDARGLRQSEIRLQAYALALRAPWRVAPRAQLTFPFWFSPTEQFLRYHAVRRNGFARVPALPERRGAGAAYARYLLENVLPGDPSDPPKPAARLLATEGVVAHLIWRIATSPDLQRRPAPRTLYARFGLTAQDVSPLENVYLKLFAALREGGYDTAAVVRAYARLFPADEPPLERIVAEALLGQRLPDGPELWLRNDAFRVGTSLFDQYRGAPRAHTFDLNACSQDDLVNIPGLREDAARRVLRHAPYASIDALDAVPGLDTTSRRTLRELHAAATDRPAADAEERLSIERILLAYLWHALAVLALCTLAAAAAHRVSRRLRWWRLLLDGFGAAAVGLAAGWLVDPGTGLVAWSTPIVVFGLPASLLAARHSGRTWRRVLVGWALAGLPAALAVRPIG